MLYYDKEVFNGDIGVITHVDMEERELTVDYDGREVVYDVSELDELTLAYATTIHKAQGSEYPIVVMPFTMSHFVMLQRNLLYTGVTRAKKILVLVGEKKAVYYAIKNETTAGRNTKLAQHATATCCRGCLEKWHQIPKGAELTDGQQEYVVEVIMKWIQRQMER